MMRMWVVGEFIFIVFEDFFIVFFNIFFIVSRNKNSILPYFAFYHV